MKSVLSDGFDSILIETYYEEQNKKSEVFLVLNKKQRKFLRQSDLNELANKIEGIRRRVAVVRLYRRFVDEWKEVNVGVLFLVETWKSLFFVMMSSKTKKEIWRVDMIGKDGSCIPWERDGDYFLIIECSHGQYGISFPKLYSMKNFVEPILVIIESKKQREKKKKKGWIQTITSFFTHVSERSFTEEPIHAPRRGMRKKSMLQKEKHKERKNQTLVINKEWRKYLTEEAGLSEEELEDEHLVRRIMNVARKLHQKNKKKMRSKKKQQHQLQQPLRQKKQQQEETEGEEEEQEGKNQNNEKDILLLLPHEKKKKHDEIDSALLKEREAEILRLQQVIKGINQLEKKKIRLFKKKVKKLEKTVSILSKKKPSCSDPNHHFEILPLSKKEDNVGPSSASPAPPPPPPSNGFEEFLKEKKKISELRKKERESLVSPPPIAKDPSNNMMDALKNLIAERREQMGYQNMGFHEDESEDEEDDDDDTW